MFDDTRRIAQTPSRRALALRAKAIDRLIEQAYYRLAAGKQIDVMNISKVYAAGRLAAETGGDVDAAVARQIAELCT